MPEGRRTLQGLLRFEGNRPVVVLLAVGALLLAVAISVAVSSLNALSASSLRVEQSLRVQSELNRLVSLNERIETARRGFLLAPDQSFVRIVTGAQSDFATSLAAAEDLVGDNGRQIDRIAEIKSLTGKRDEAISESILTPATTAARVREAGIDNDPGVQITRRIREIGRVMLDEEDSLLLDRNRAQSASQTRFYLIGGLATAMLLATLGAVIVLVLRFNRDLSLAQIRLRQANEGLEGAVAARTSELRRANQEIQRFAYIVSHDLRSPLVNVLGFTAELDEARKTIRAYLEDKFAKHPGLRDDNVWRAVDEDLPEALGFIRTSTEKMDRLINSILELSRQGRRPLSPQWLDMTALAEGVIANLHQRALDAGATLNVEPLPRLETDRLAIEQILSNLVENAIKYLSPKRAGEIVISGREAGIWVEIDVTDNGRGISPADHQRIFELFRRSGIQDKPGEGIGLANVRALAYRLGGTVEVESELDQGARFRLSLPAQFVATEETHD